jgi:Protein of unknown function (DUF664)
VTWIAPDAERSEDYPARRNEPEREMLRDWLDWHRATLLRKCAGLDAARLAKLDGTFTFRQKTTSVRWMWQHLVEEYARHNGHADLLREAIDGSAGL